jgi:hypothetical protein
MTHETQHELIGYLLRQIEPRPIVREIVNAAYAVGYDQQSDGITFMHELNFRGMKMPHPLGVGHDLLYALGVKSPWLPKTATSDTVARRWADNWFRDGMRDFGHWARAPVWWLGLRLGAWHGWNCHRRNGNPLPELLQAVIFEWRRARILGEFAGG